VDAQVNSAAELLRAFTDRSGTIGIVGLGYVGLPLARATLEAGFSVVGLDIDQRKIDMLHAGNAYIKQVDPQYLLDKIGAGSFEVTTDFAALSRADAIIICVPTPLTKYREPDLSYVVNTAGSIAPHLRKNQLVVLESTTYPGTTRELLVPALEKSGLTCGTDFYVAFSPEREDPGNTDFSTKAIPKVVGGVDETSLQLAMALYGQIVVSTVAVSSTATAEAVKITENIFRSVNIALVNELKLIFGAMDIDIWEVIEAAKTKPFGYMPFYPGPGLGGHCIPIDPFYLTWKAREFGMTTQFIELAGQINTSMPRHVVTVCADAMNARFARGLNGVKVLLVGLAYKKNVDDTRESPGLTLIELLEAHGAAVDYHDPHVPVVPVTREHPEIAGRASVKGNAETFASYDLALIATDHDDVDYSALVANSKLVVDTRNACHRRGLTGSNIVKA
jgi:UDP-N-acetyl-D-glucosamine dehydrogenase